jgi:hypothetical protein
MLIAVSVIFIPGVALGSLITDGVAVAEAWFRMSNFQLCTAVSLWLGSLHAIGKIRGGTKLNPTLAGSLAFTMYCVNLVCLTLVVMHFLPETGAVFDWILSLFERIIG